jgi:hypothetical protein
VRTNVLPVIRQEHFESELGFRRGGDVCAEKTECGEVCSGSGRVGELSGVGIVCAGGVVGSCVDGDVAERGRDRLVQGLTGCVMASDMLMGERGPERGCSGEKQGKEGRTEEHGGFEHEDVGRREDSRIRSAFFIGVEIHIPIRSSRKVDPHGVLLISRVDGCTRSRSRSSGQGWLRIHK